MGRKKNLEDCNCARDFTKWARRRGADVITGGRHIKIRYNGYSVPVPSHGEIKPGTKRSIIKSLIKIGLAALFLIGSFVTGGYLALLMKGLV